MAGEHARDDVRNSRFDRMDYSSAPFADVSLPMGRKLRIQMPGAPYHLTARLHGGEPLFRGIEEEVVSSILRTAATEGTSIVAYAVMPNHLHLLAVHGRRRLSTLMQPLLRRIALMVQRKYERRGRVFERPYRDSICLDPAYARNVVTYVHLNPVRAGLSAAPGGYPWTSHQAYITAASDGPELFRAGVVSFLRLFADERGRSVTECRDAYVRFIAWRAAVDRAAKATGEAYAKPDTWGGDSEWRELYGLLPENRWAEQQLLPGRPDPEEIARAVIRDEAPDWPLDDFRRPGKSPRHVAIRRLVILNCVAAGYANHQIARYLRVSESTVSKARMSAAASDMAVTVK